MDGVDYMKRVVILGGGYGGYKIANLLVDKGIPKDYQVTLVDRLAFHSLKTEFYALASGSISDFQARMVFPEGERFSVVNGEITSIDLLSKQIHIRDKKEPLSYDFLVIGLGCEDNYHHIEGAKEFTNSIQTLTKTRRTYEAINNVDPNGHISIVGGGLSGVELAAELRETRPDLNIRIFDRGHSVLKPYPVKLQEYVTDWFVKHDIEIYAHTHIEHVEKNMICHNSFCTFSDAIVWTAGVQPVQPVRDLHVAKDKTGRIVLNDFYQIPEHQEVFVVGDCASLPFAPSAQLAQHQGEQLATILHSIMKGENPKKPSSIQIKGTLGSLGKKDGFGVVYNRSITGTVPKLMKSGTLWAHKLYKY